MHQEQLRCSYLLVPLQIDHVSAPHCSVFNNEL